MCQPTLTDFPAAAHAKAASALEEFSTLTTEYSVLLDVGRAMLSAGNLDGAADAMERGDRVVRMAAACGRRLAPWREAVESRQYAGPRLSDLERRLGAAAARAAVIVAGATSVETVCLGKRDEAAAEMGEGIASAAQRIAAGGYRPRIASSQAFDTHA